MSLTRWRIKKNGNKDAEKEALACRRWMEEGDLPSTASFESAVAPTAIDPPTPELDEDAAMGDDKDKKRSERGNSELKSPPKKRTKGDDAKNAKSIPGRSLMKRSR